MNKLKYAKANIPNCWDYINGEKEIIEHLCPSDFELNNSNECHPMIGDMPCEKCWKEEY